MLVFASEVREWGGVMTKDSEAWYEKTLFLKIFLRVVAFVGLLSGMVFLGRSLEQVPWNHGAFVASFIGCGALFIVASVAYERKLSSDALKKNVTEYSAQIAWEAKKREELAEIFRGQFAVTAEKLHFAVHEIRNEFAKLLNLAEAPPGHRRLLPVHAGTKVVNLLADFLTHCVGQPVSVCIKVLDKLPDNRMELVAPSFDELKTMNVVTVCRSSNTQKERFEEKLHPIVDNTAFNDIIYRGEPFFAQSDLEEEWKQKRYSNTTPNWMDYYKSAIVVPIRLSIGTTNDRVAVYDLLAFLCADAKDPNAFERLRIRAYADFLMAVGDALYHYFDFFIWFQSPRPEIETQEVSQLTD